MNEVKFSEAQDSWSGLFSTGNFEDGAYDGIILFKSANSQPKYALFYDGGCSCGSPLDDDPDGDVYTKTQLIKLVKNWHDDGSEKIMRQWILENIPTQDVRAILDTLLGKWCVSPDFEKAQINEALKAITDYYLGLLPEKKPKMKYIEAMKDIRLMEISFINSGFNDCRDKMEASIKGGRNDK